MSVWFAYARARQRARFWELPFCFELDDWPYFQFNFEPYRHGWGSAEHGARELAKGELDWMHEREDGGLLTVCMHPQVIGRGHRMAMLGRFVDHCRDAGATLARIGDVARALDGRSET